jgi:cation transport ATPase
LVGAAARRRTGRTDAVEEAVMVQVRNTRTTHRPASEPWDYHSARRRWWLITLEAFLAIQAVYGGISLILGVWDLDSSALRYIPFVSGWPLPGAALIAVVAIPMLTAAWLELWDHRLAPTASVLAGALLMVWIAAQLVLVPSMHLWLQPVCFVAGAVVAGGALPRRRRSRPS